MSDIFSGVFFLSFLTIAGVDRQSGTFAAESGGVGFGLSGMASLPFKPQPILFLTFHGKKYFDQSLLIYGNIVMAMERKLFGHVQKFINIFINWIEGLGIDIRGQYILPKK